MPPRTIVITHNPVTAWENYHRTLSAGHGDFRDYVDDDRAMGGFWSCTFKMEGRANVLKDFFRNGLGRNVEVYGDGMELLHEGFVYEMVYNFPPDRFLLSLKNMLNKIHMRADLDADGEVERSTVLENLLSQGRWGIKEHVVSGGQIDSLAVADQAVQAYIDLRSFPQPQVDRGKGRGEPYIEIFSKGYIETLAWRLFNCEDVGTQGTSAEVEDIVGHRASVRVIKPSNWDQLADFEERDLTDFDALSPGLTWDQEADGEEGDETDWDIVTEGGNGVLDVHGDAKKNGDWGWKVTVAGAGDTAYGQLSDPAAETEFTAECWFDINSLAMASGDAFQLIYETSHEIFVTLQYDGSNYAINITTLSDAGYESGVAQTISDDWHSIRVVWKASTGAGNDDGFMYLYIDGEYATGITGIDNDTKSIDLIQFGACAGLDVGTSGVFYMDDCRWDAAAGPMGAYSFARRNGSYGMAIFVPDTTPRYGELTDPANETEITVETWINPIGLTMATDDEFVCTALREDGAGVDVARINLLYDGTDYALRIEAREDGGAYVASSAVPIANHYGHARLVLIASSGAGNDDGYLFLYWNELKILEISGLDNDTLNVDRVRSGAVSGLDAGTLGGLMLDHIRWSDDAVVTRTAESGVGQFVAGLEISTNDTQVTTKLDADLRALDTVFNQAKLGDASNNRWLVYMTKGRIMHFAQAAPAVEVV